MMRLLSGVCAVLLLVPAAGCWCPPPLRLRVVPLGTCILGVSTTSGTWH
jgi:hypothetical protein